MSNYSLLLAMVMLMVCYSALASAAYTQGINLGTCANFAAQAGTAVNFNGVTTMVTGGHVGVSPGTSITGSYVLSSGSVQNNSPLAIQCAADEMTAYLAAKALVCPAANNLANPDLGGVTLPSGVYCSSFMQINAGTLTLDGQGNSDSVWVFQTATTMITGASTSFILKNGAQAKNIYWQLGTALTVGTGSTFAGTVLSGTAINLFSGAALNGRALAQSAIVCATGNAITAPSTVSQPSKAPTKPTPSFRPSKSGPKEE